MHDFHLTLDDIRPFGSGLKRPECVACTAAGEIWVSHAPATGGGGVASLSPEGALDPIVADDSAPGDFMPNGWSMDADGSFLIANLNSLTCT